MSCIYYLWLHQLQSTSDYTNQQQLLIKLWKKQDIKVTFREAGLRSGLGFIAQKLRILHFLFLCQGRLSR